MVANVMEISHKMKNKNLLSIEKNIGNEKKCLIMIIKKHFNLKNFASL